MKIISGGYDSNTAREIIAAVCSLGLLDYIDLDVGQEPLQLHYGMPTGFSQAGT